MNSCMRDLVCQHQEADCLSHVNPGSQRNFCFTDPFSDFLYSTTPSHASDVPLIEPHSRGTITVAAPLDYVMCHSVEGKDESGK